jgi:hypothetical protein
VSGVAPPERLAALLRAADPIAAARAAGIAPGGEIAWTRGPDPTGWLVDGDAERPVAEHRAAHAAGRPSVAALAYGRGADPDRIAARLHALALIAAETGLLRAVCPVPGEGAAGRPGSWGVEDLTVVAVCRLALPDDVRVRPHWRLLGAGACQVAAAFGADEWVLPAGSADDPPHLAEAVGRRAVAR